MTSSNTAAHQQVTSGPLGSTGRLANRARQHFAATILVAIFLALLTTSIAWSITWAPRIVVVEPITMTDGAGR